MSKEISPMFEYTSRMNEAFGNRKGDPYKYLPDAAKHEAPEEVEKAWQRLENQCWGIAGDGNSIVYGEVQELHEALGARDINKVRDALGDILVFTLGAFHIAGYDADRDMHAILDGVMTRFCRNQAELDVTLIKLQQRGIPPAALRLEGSYPTLCVKAAVDIVTTDNGERIAAGKFLKSAYYKEPLLYALPDREYPPEGIGDKNATVGTTTRRFMGQHSTNEAEFMGNTPKGD